MTGGAGRIALLAAGLALSGATPPNDRDDGRGLRRCTDIRGYLDDETPGGREVHARPDRRSPVLGRILEPQPVDPDFSRAVSFDIAASRDGWLRIEGAGDDPELTGMPARPMYAGSGWIRGAGISVTVQASQAFAAPRHSSEMVFHSNDGAYMDSQEVDAIAACDGNWVLARWKIAEPANFTYSPNAIVSGQPLILQGWATGICNIQETSCDMASGDRPGSR